MVRTKRIVPSIALAAGLIGASAAKADTIYNVAFQGADVFGDKLTITGQITASSTMNLSGSYNVTSITGTWQLTPSDPSQAPFSLSISGLSKTIGDNVMLSGKPYLSGNGVGFTLPSGYSDSSLFYNSSLGQYCGFVNSDSGNACGTGSITPALTGATPEPGTMTLLGIGLFAGMIVLRRAA